MRIFLFYLSLIIPLQAYSFCGFYIGESVGLSTNFMQDKGDSKGEFDLAFADFLSFSESIDVSLYQHKLFGELFLGYGRRLCCNGYLGVRCGVNFSSYNKENTRENIGVVPQAETDFFILTHTLKERFNLNDIEYTFDMKFGWIFCEKTLLYGLLGVALNEKTLILDADLRFANEISGVNGVQLRTEAIGVDSQKGAYFRLGFGIEQMLTRCISYHLQYVYTDYGSLETSVSSENTFQTADVLGSTASAEGYMQRSVFSTGLNYHF